MYIGDFRLGTTFDVKFTTRRFTTGVPLTLAGSPVISVYENNSTSQGTAGITLTVDFDGVTGLNNVRVVAVTAGLSSGANYALVITTGTVDGVSVVGEVVASFSVENRSALMPTTVGRTLDVSAGGEAGVDWANVGSPTTTVGLSGTTVKTATDVETKVNTIDDFLDTEIAGIVTTLGTPAGASVSADIAAIEAQTDDIGTAGAGLTAVPWNAAWDAEVQSEATDALNAYDPPTNTEMEARTIAAANYATASALDTVDNFLDTEIADIQGRLPAALVSGRMDASIGAAAANTITASALAVDAVSEIQSGLSTLTAAQVNTEVLDVLTVDTFAEASAVPAATSTLKDKLNWLFALARNKLTQTSTTQTVYADDASTPVATSAVADDGTTASRNEWA